MWYKFRKFFVGVSVTASVGTEVVVRSAFIEVICFQTKPSIIIQAMKREQQVGRDSAAAAAAARQIARMSPTQIASDEQTVTGINSRRSAISRQRQTDGRWSMCDTCPLAKPPSPTESAKICNHSWTARFNSSSRACQPIRRANTLYFLHCPTQSPSLLWRNVQGLFGVQFYTQKQQL